MLTCVIEAGGMGKFRHLWHARGANYSCCTTPWHTPSDCVRHWVRSSSARDTALQNQQIVMRHQHVCNYAAQ